MNRPPHGSVLVVGLMLLSVISLLGLAAAAAAQVELQLARNEQFRENAATAASAGIETAISQVTASITLPARISASLPGTRDHFEVELRLRGHEEGLPQPPGANLAGAHIEILSTGHAARGAWDRQRALVMHVVQLAASEGSDCQPALPDVPCAAAGELRRLSWQRLPRD